MKHDFVLFFCNFDLTTHEKLGEFFDGLNENAITIERSTRINEHFYIDERSGGNVIGENEFDYDDDVFGVLL